MSTLGELPPSWAEAQAHLSLLGHAPDDGTVSGSDSGEDGGTDSPGRARKRRRGGRKHKKVPPPPPERHQRDGPDAVANHYKTRLCKDFESRGACPWGIMCIFAHGVAELRTHLDNERLGVTNDVALQRERAKMMPSDRPPPITDSIPPYTGAPIFSPAAPVMVNPGLLGYPGMATGVPHVMQMMPVYVPMYPPTRVAPAPMMQQQQQQQHRAVTGMPLPIYGTPVPPANYPTFAAPTFAPPTPDSRGLSAAAVPFSPVGFAPVAFRGGPTAPPAYTAARGIYDGAPYADEDKEVLDLLLAQLRSIE